MSLKATHAFQAAPYVGGQFSPWLSPWPTKSCLTAPSSGQIRAARGRGVLSMALRAVEAYDGAFGLDADVRDSLVRRLTDPEFAGTVAEQGNCERAHFNGDLFQPIPYSLATPRGMPRDIEAYARDPNFIVINIPPTLMFEARCFKPSRLCAVFRLYGVSESKLEAHAGRERESQNEAELHSTQETPAAQPASSPLGPVAGGVGAWTEFGSLLAESVRDANAPLSEEEERELDDLVV